MPTAPKRPCRHPGCPTLIPSGSYCMQHQRSSGRAVYDATKRKLDPALAEAARIRNGGTWHRCRDSFKAQHPLCCDPYSLHRDRPALTSDAHHIDPLGKRPDLAYDWDNLAPLCTSCHADVERRERRGEDTRDAVRRAKGGGHIAMQVNYSRNLHELVPANCKNPTFGTAKPAKSAGFYKKEQK